MAEEAHYQEGEGAEELLQQDLVLKKRILYFGLDCSDYGKMISPPCLHLFEIRIENGNFSPRGDPESDTISSRSGGISPSPLYLKIFIKYDRPSGRISPSFLREYSRMNTQKGKREKDSHRGGRGIPPMGGGGGGAPPPPPMGLFIFWAT